ncbi:MAG: hypothetical protein LUE87_02835 [Lachnospiraceae bacterium]|nr:hypothetical protein [Lachnospiraceae bacterium]
MNINLKNNHPTVFILSPKEYDRLTELEENYVLLFEAYERLEKHGNEPGIPMADVMARHGISESDLNQTGDVEIE